MIQDLFTDEIKAFIAENHKKLTMPQIIKILHSEFNATEITLSRLKNYYHYNGIRSGIKYINNMAGWNKGIKMKPSTYEKCSATMFKKGQIPPNKKPIGSERVNVDGYIEIKVTESGNWKLKHRYVYEQHHNVKLGRNDIVTFLDGNPLNCNIENLVKVDQTVLRTMNQKFSQFNVGDVEIKKSIIALVNNIEAVRRIKNKKKE